MNTTYVDAEKEIPKKSKAIKLYRKEDFVNMRAAGQVTAKCLDSLVDLIKPGVSTKEIDEYIFDFGVQHHAIPATLGYRGYGFSSCTSINEVVCHGIPSERKLENGDIINVDITFILDGWHGDSSRMYGVGEIKRKAQKLIDTTYESLILGIQKAKPGNTTGDIGSTIQKHVERHRFSIVREFCGHGIGRLFHENPNILHFGQRKSGDVLKPGMIFTIEPMVNFGKAGIRVRSDNWTAETQDGSLSAQFEHTVGITESGCEIFTKSPQKLDKPPLMNANS